MHSMYNVPIIPQNLRREETIVQIADSLRYLENVASDIFNRVNDRITTYSGQLSSLSERIDAAGTKISKLAGANKATQVFSSSKYPAAHVHKRYVSIFDGKTTVKMIRSKVKYKETQIKEEPLEKLQFYHVKLPEVIEKVNNNGLGNIPCDIESLNDLLLYNTGKNPYKNYVMSDTLQVSQRIKKDEDVDISDIGAAPHSITERTGLTRSATESYFYSPDLGNVPVIDVPLDLPDLPGIADDLRYINEPGPGIAPSETTTPSVPDLPVLKEIISNDVSVEVEPTVIVPPPPYEESVPTVAFENPVELLEEKPLATTPTVDTNSNHVSSEGHNKATKLPAIGDTHANLMDAIRKAGGAKNLKSSEPKKSEKASMSGGDLMADLHAKLSLRRKGISGAKNQDGSAFDSSAMNKVSAMIPPPPTKNAELTESTNTEDEDWDE